MGFIFNKKLFFCQHIDFYMNKVISTVKSMKMLGNLSRGLISTQKCLLYRMHILSIVLYSFSIWYYNNVLLSYSLKVFRLIQRKATLWIFGVFWTSFFLGIKAITGFILKNLYLWKLSRRLQLHTQLLFLSQYTLWIKINTIYHWIC